MSGRFEWEHEDEGQLEDEPAPAVRARRMPAFVAVLLFAAVLFAAGYVALSRQARIDATAAIQLVLDVARDACRAGDEELFFSLQSDDPVWRASLQQPQNYGPICAGQSVVELRPSGINYTATLADGDGIRRLAFFQVTPGGTRQIAPLPDYWKGRFALPLADGNTLIYRKLDEPFVTAIVAFVEAQVREQCAGGGCRDDARPFTLEIRRDYRQTAEPGMLTVASPRLLGLDADGNPAPPFWEAVSAELAAHLTPGVIRFAVPPRLHQAIVYENAAAEFMRQNPDVIVQIIPLDLMPEEADESLTAYDGAAYSPTASMIAAGLVRDVTDYAATDPDFHPEDMYELIWAGAQWRGRTWFVPHAGQMRFLYYDRNAYELAGLPEPLPRRPWDELERDIEALGGVSAATFEGWSGEWVFLDATRDILFAHAFAHARCPARPNPCQLSPAGVRGAFDWYQAGLAGGTAPDLAASPPSDRLRLMANRQGVPRQAAIWVDDAVSYEHYLQMWPVGATPFPAGSTPLWVHGSFISSHSERPRDVWRWLSILSHQPLNGPLRYVPARLSVAERTSYWQNMPRSLRGVALAAFRTARPVPLEWADAFSRERLDDMLRDQSTADISPPVRWFGR